MPGDVDTFQFETLAGTRLSVDLERSGDSEVSCALEVYGPWGEVLVMPGELTEETETFLSVRNWSLPATGLYTLRVLQTAGDGM